MKFNLNFNVHLSEIIELNFQNLSFSNFKVKAFYKKFRKRQYTNLDNLFSFS